MDIKTGNTGRAAGLCVTVAPAMVVAVLLSQFLGCYVSVAAFWEFKAALPDYTNSSPAWCGYLSEQSQPSPLSLITD